MTPPPSATRSRTLGYLCLGATATWLAGTALSGLWWLLPGAEPLPEGFSSLSLVGETAADSLTWAALATGALGLLLLTQGRWAQGRRAAPVRPAAQGVGPQVAGPKHFPSASHR